MRRFLLSLITTAAALALTATPALAQDATPPPPLAPPPPIDPSSPGAPTGDPNAPTTPEQATTKKLDEAEREDSGRNFELIYIDALLGISNINMNQLAESGSKLGLEKASSTGPVVSLGAGIRLVVLTLGVRAKYNALSAFNMWQLNGEVGLKIPISTIDILIGLHGGYSFVGNLGEGTVATNNGGTPTNADSVKIRGFNVGIDLALDYYVTPYFSLGAGFFGDFLFLNRPPLDKPPGLTPQEQMLIDSDPRYQQSGTSAGLQLGGGLRAGVHFGL